MDVCQIRRIASSARERTVHGGARLRRRTSHRAPGDATSGRVIPKRVTNTNARTITVPTRMKTHAWVIAWSPAAAISVWWP